MKARHLCLAVALWSVSLAGAKAQEVADFYRGKQIRAIVSTVVGGDYDTWMRLITRHWSKYIPGHPSMLVQNMPGAGGIVAANSFYHTAPRDGSSIAMIGRNLAYQALMKEDGIRFDPMKFNWIGSPEVSNRICVVMDASRVKTAADLYETELLMGGAGAGTAVSTTPRLVAALTGMKMKLVEGYGSASAVQLAMERGEVDGVCQTVCSSIWNAIPSLNSRCRRSSILHLPRNKSSYYCCSPPVWSSDGRLWLHPKHPPIVWRCCARALHWSWLIQPCAMMPIE